MNTVAWITSKGEQHDIKDIEARRTKLNIEDLPKNLSAFSNDMGFINNTVDNLINYYKKSETYTKNEIDQKLSAKWDSKFVDELPTEDISTSTIYFLKRKKEQGTTQYENDVYDEYIYTGTWELIGNTYVDLSDYYRKSEVKSIVESKIAVESQARQLADSTLQNNINSVQANVDNVSNALSSETLKREQLDIRLTESIGTVSDNLNSEISRAKSAENTLSDRCDTYDNHLNNISNPHSVTAEQVGLGNVTNVGTTDTITPNSTENITSGAVYTALKNKIDKIDGRGLSEQNFTYAEKTKLAGLSNYNDTALKNRVTATENAITTLNGNSSVNGSVDKKIADAIAGVTQIDFKIVSELPSTGIKGTIYLIRGTGTEATQQYDEYIWVDGKWEKLGKSTIEVDLSDIYSKSEVNALVSVKNDKITITDDSSSALTDANTFSTTSDSGTNPTNLTKRPLSLLWNYIKGKISSVLGLTKDNYGGKASSAGTADKTVNALTVNGKTYDGSSAVNAGVQTVANGGTGVTTQADINKAFIGNLEVGNSDVTDGTEFVSSYATNNGFSEPGYVNMPFRRKFSKVWNYIKGKADSVYAKLSHTHTKSEITDFPTSLPANGGTANKIEPNYTRVTLTPVTSETIKYIKVADCSWSHTGTLQVLLEGNAFQDTLVINFGGGDATTPMLCGYYNGNSNGVYSVIVQKGSHWTSDYSIYVKIGQRTTCNVSVALLTGNCTINITESTTAPTNISEWSVGYGLFGTFTGNLTGSATQIADGAVTNAKIADGAITNAKIGETISIAKGGTGKTKAKEGFMSLANGLTVADGVEDGEFLIYKNATGSNWGIYTFSTLWNYIKYKILAMTGWITAGMCRSGSNLYMHYISLATSDGTKYVLFSFPSAQADSYTSFSALLTALGNLFENRRFSCNGVVSGSGSAFETILFGYVTAQASSLRIVAMDSNGKKIETSVTKIDILVDTVVPIISN